jgi:N6-L-threonylcarbamoyladenine synthase
MSEICYLGIDTSNYTTSLALADKDGQIIANLKAPLPVKDGERGLRQSDALFAHTKNLPGLTDQLRTILEGYTVAGIGYSTRPRSVEGSYMPCFLAGVSAAHAMMAVTGAPGIEVSHQDGHVMAAMYSAGAIETLMQTPFAAFHVSGGTTELLYVNPHHDGFDISLVGQSLDLHAGQAVDRICVAMGMHFPCGPALEKAAAECTVRVPKPRICVKGCDCHLSGLENLALSLYEKTGDISLCAAYTLDFIAQSLLGMCDGVKERYGDIPLLFAGGVMSNRRIQQTIAAKYPSAYFASPAFSADNAAGVALLCRRALVTPRSVTK